MKLPETRGRRPLKTFTIEPGELKEFDPRDKQAIYYRARVEGWKINVRTVDGVLLVFRKM